MLSKILVVCVGNICRSPLAERILQAKLNSHFCAQPGADNDGGDSGEIDQKGFIVSSAGLRALAGKPIAPYSADILQQLSIDFAHHMAKQLTREMAQRNDLLLVMEKQHMSNIHSMWPETRGKVQLIGKWNDSLEIPDPYNKSREYFNQVHRLLEPCIDNWIRVLTERA